MAPWQRDAVIVVTADPVMSNDVLLSAVVDAGTAGLGACPPGDVTPGPGGSVLLTLPGDLWAGTASSPRVARLERAVASALAAGGHPGVSVAVAVVEMSTAARSPMRGIVQSWIEEQARDAIVASAIQALRAELTRLVSHRLLRTVFQPIVDVQTGTVFAYEALSRGPMGHALEMPSDLIEAALATGLDGELDAEMAALALANASRALTDPAALLFVNTLSAQGWDLTHPFREGDEPWPAGRTIVEVTERHPIVDVELFTRNCGIARSRGIQFALDDAGAGYAGLSTVALLAPEFIKVDMGLVRGCDGDPRKQHVIAAVVFLSDRTGSRVIAEGVETEAELGTLRGLGVGLVQGHLVGRPTELPAPDADAGTVVDLKGLSQPSGHLRVITRLASPGRGAGRRSVG